MSKKTLISTIRSKFPQYQRDSIEQCVDLIVGEIADSIVMGRRVEIRGFGVFTLRRIGPRQRRNPKTGETVFLAETYRPQFKPSSKLKQLLNRSGVPTNNNLS